LVGWVEWNETHHRFFNNPYNYHHQENINNVIEKNSHHQRGYPIDGMWSGFQ
jgi:hypothetical protein